MIRILTAAFILIGLSLGASARSIHGSGGSGSLAGRAVINIGGDFLPVNVINVLKTASLSFNTPSDISKVDDDGYLTSSPTSNVNVSFPSAGTMWTNTQYKLRWDAGVQFSGLTFNSSMTSCSAVAATFTGCSGVGNTTITTTGGAGSVTFTTNTPQFGFFFASGSTASHSSGELALYRVSDETDYLAGEIFTTQYRSLVAGLHPRAIRPMGWVNGGAGNFNGETTWNYRVKTTTMTWGARYPLGAYGGAVTNTSDAFSGGAQPDAPADWTDGEMYVGVFAATNTTTAPTFSIAGHTGTKTILRNTGTAIGVGEIAVGIGVVVYDAVLGKVIYNPGGMVGSIPIEAQINLANKLRVDIWPIIPAWARDNYVTNWATVIRDNLSAALYAYPEYTNEVWNFGFPQTHWSNQRGLVFGWVQSSNQALYGWYGLRVRQIMGNLIPAVFSGQMSRVRRVMALQGFGDTTNITNRFSGSQLRSCASFAPPCGNAAYDVYTGSANYSVKPNRPIDPSDTISGAPYAGGTNLCTGPDIGCTPTALNAPFYQTLVTNWEGANQAAAITAIDDDIQTGRTNIQNVTASGATFTTGSNHHLSPSASFTASIGATFTGTRNTASQITAASVVGLISVGDTIAGTGIPGGTTITSQISGTTGSAGVYATSVDTTAASAAVTDSSNILNVTAVASGFIEVGQALGGTGLDFLDIQIISQQPNSGVGTYRLSQAPRQFASGPVTSARGVPLIFQVSGGTIYSGITAYKAYAVSTAATATTFTIKQYVGNNSSGADINAGTAGTGTMTVGATSTNLTFIAGTFNLFMESLAATYDGDRPAGAANLRIDLYEGNLEPKGLTSAQCAALGVTGTDCAGSTAAAIVGWKNDPKASLTQQAYFRQFVGTDPAMPTTFGLMSHAQSPSQLVLLCGGDYGLVPDCFPTTTPYQTYNGFSTFSAP